jgi:hypothetical protein
MFLCVTLSISISLGTNLIAPTGFLRDTFHNHTQIYCSGVQSATTGKSHYYKWFFCTFFFSTHDFALVGFRRLLNLQQ